MIIHDILHKVNKETTVTMAGGGVIFAPIKFFISYSSADKSNTPILL